MIYLWKAALAKCALWDVDSRKEGLSQMLFSCLGWALEWFPGLLLYAQILQVIFNSDSTVVYSGHHILFITITYKYKYKYKNKYKYKYLDKFKDTA